MRPAFFRLIVRDVEGELQRMPEGMRQAVMLAAVSTDGYEVIATRLNNESWDVQIWAVSRAAANSYEILAVQRWVDDVLLTEMA